MFCQKCGNKVNEGDRFCASCGAPVKLPINNEVKKIQLGGVEMSAEDMRQYCIKNHYLKTDNFDTFHELNVKIYKGMFESLINEVQNDETPILCFVGAYDYKNVLSNAGERTYLLTNKRIISAGFYSSTLATFNPLNNFPIFYKSFISKNPKFKVSALYLRDIIDVTENMVSNHDVITFNTAKDSINVLFYMQNVTHRLCDQINAVIKEYREQNHQ